jgi:hypothetical protein
MDSSTLSGRMMILRRGRSMAVKADVLYLLPVNQ